MKKMVLIIMALCMITTLGIATAQANPWFYANVMGVGTGGSTSYIVLTDAATTPQFTNMFFTLDPTSAKLHLATGLTAASLGTKVQVNFVTNAAVPVEGTVVRALYLDNGYH